jgi:hypothetical protein
MGCCLSRNRGFEESDVSRINIRRYSPTICESTEDLVGSCTSRQKVSRVSNEYYHIIGDQ